MAKIFAKFGTKRDENLGDLQSGAAALNVLLDRIKGGREKFTLEDLDLIKDIFTTDITTGTFESASSATVRFTAPNGTSQVYEPLITLQNRFDRAYFTTSEPFFFGGDGLTARYFDDQLVLRASGRDSTSDWIGYDQFKDETGRPVIDPALEVERATDKDQFWEEGDFVYGNKIVNKLLTAYGGVEWSGFYKTNVTGAHSIRITTTGFLRVEFDNKEAPSKEFTFDPSTGTFKLDDLDFNNPSGMTTLLDQTKLVSSGVITSVNITGTTLTGNQINANYGTITTFKSTPASGSGASFEIRRNINGGLFVSQINGGSGYQSNDTFIISGALLGGSDGTDDATITVTSIGGYEVFNSLSGTSTGFQLGQNRTVVISLDNLEEYVPYKIRISFFMDEDAVEKTQELSGSSPLEKRAIIRRIAPLSDTERFDYKFLYNEKYFDFYNIGDFKQFIDDSISVGGTKIGRQREIGKQTATITNGTGVSGDNYSSLSNLNPIVSYYKSKIDAPATSLVSKRTGTYSINGIQINFPNNVGLNVGLPNKTEGIEIGNYVLANGIFTGSRVSAVNLDAGVRIDMPTFLAQTNAEISFIDHKGLVAFGTAGRYSSDIIAGGITESGFSFGQRGIANVFITDGATINISQAGSDYGSFNVGSNLNSNTSSGSGATFNISRNSFGALVITVTNAGTGYSNYEYFTVSGSLIGNPNNLTFEIRSLTDCFFTGKPEYIISGDQILKQENWTDNFTYSDQIDDPTSPSIRVSSNAAIIDRFQSGVESVRSLPNNSFVLKNQEVDVSPLVGTNRFWMIYQSFGLNNDALAPYCIGVTAKRILQKLEVVNGGSGYATPLTSGNGAAVTGGSGSGMRVYYEVSGGSITYAWIEQDGTGYESGNIVTVQTGGANATLRVGYPSTSNNSIVLRLSDAKELSVGDYVHLFPSIFFLGENVNELSSDVQITSIDWSVLGGSQPNDPAALVTISRPSGPVLNSSINYTPSVVTRVTFSPTSINKEVCFRPTDTSPPFGATARGLSTAFDVSMVLDFTSSGTADSGVPNTSSTLSYDSLELETDTSINEIPTNNNDFVGGYLPIQTPTGLFYLILRGTI